MKVNQFEEILAIQELDDETGAAIQGGYAMELFDGYDGKTGWLGSFDTGTKYKFSDRANDKVSSIIINDGEWTFYEHADLKGRSITLNKANYWTLKGHFLDNKISSFQRVDRA